MDVIAWNTDNKRLKTSVNSLIHRIGFDFEMELVAKQMGLSANGNNTNKS